ncbi:MAG TPA: metallophosphoesterase family protein [Elusimicrobiales bacterium]|nr:metallophosphoesterase family protein [Elusimicrobiales bacterium]
MIYGIFSDVHSNLHALEVVLNYFRKAGVKRYVFCGDIIGYGPKPNECVERISQLKNCCSVMGNHDATALGIADLSKFTGYAAYVIEHTKKILTAKSKYFLINLKQIETREKFTVVHGSCKDPLVEYLNTGEQFLDNLHFFKTQICFTGHTHIPLTFTRKGVQFPEVKLLTNNESIYIEKKSRYVLNPGSVGQPRDGNPCASCAIYDSAKNNFEIIRLDYPFQLTQKEMQKLKFPKFLIQRLEKGL